MLCQNCHKNLASVHVTEIAEANAPSEEVGGPEAVIQQISERHLCEICAQTMDLPHSPISPQKKNLADIWKLLQISAQQNRKVADITCPDCGMTLEEFRNKGRLGCPRDYEVFRAHVGELLERVHGARQHVGRIPGVSDSEIDRIQQLDDLKQELEVAIREEDYEQAAALRDRIRALETETSEADADRA